MIRIKKIGVLQTAKVFGVIYALISLVIVLPFALLGSILSEEMFPEFQDLGALALIVLPIIYGIIGFIFTAISCAIYNLIAGFTGGIEMELESVDG